jgi:hypothetical protein
VRPVTRPSRDLFHHAVDHGAAEYHRPTTQRDEAAMRSLRFPFDETTVDSGQVGAICILVVGGE